MISIQTEDVDIGGLIQAAKHSGAGAIVVFDGIVRDDDLTEMELEAYDDVALRELQQVAADAGSRYDLLSVSIVHRIGSLRVGDNILVIVVSAAHRKEAYDGSRFILETIKERVPVWKKEIRTGGNRWVPSESEDN